MAKGTRVIGVITEPAPPTWWKANRHRVCLAFGLWAGWQLCANFNGHAAVPESQPAYTGPAVPGPDASVQPLRHPTPAR